MNQLILYVSTLNFYELRELVTVLNMRQLLPKKYTKLSKNDLREEVLKHLTLIQIDGKTYVSNKSYPHVEIMTKEQRKLKRNQEKEQKRINDLILNAVPSEEKVDKYEYNNDDSEIENLKYVSDSESDYGDDESKRVPSEE